jgi:hypothetical protein
VVAIAVVQAARLGAGGAHVPVHALALAGVAKAVVIAAVNARLGGAQLARPARGTHAGAIVALAMEGAVVRTNLDVACVTRPALLAAALSINTVATTVAILGAGLHLARGASPALLAGAHTELLAGAGLTGTCLTTARVARVTRALVLRLGRGLLGRGHLRLLLGCGSLLGRGLGPLLLSSLDVGVEVAVLLFVKVHLPPGGCSHVHEGPVQAIGDLLGRGFRLGRARGLAAVMSTEVAKAVALVLHARAVT